MHVKVDRPVPVHVDKPVPYEVKVPYDARKSIIFKANYDSTDQINDHNELRHFQKHFAT